MHFREIYYSLIDRLDSWLWNLSCLGAPYSYVLMFHDITIEKSNANQSCVHSFEEFTSILSRYQQKGYQTVSIDKAINERNKDCVNIAITFDDVYESVYKYAYPILKEQKIPFTLFIAVDLIGAPEMATESQIKEMAADDLCTIGAHTLSHGMLRKVKNSYEEMALSKKKLEQLIGKKVEYLAYPYGKHSSVSMRIMGQAKRIGFKRAFGTINAPLNRYTSLFNYYLPRIVVH